MNVRPTPHTPYELKLRLEEEQRFYEAHGDGLELPLAGIGSVANVLADGLDAVSHLLRSVGNAANHRHAA